jgi:hypothetical protein
MSANGATKKDLRKAMESLQIENAGLKFKIDQLKKHQLSFDIYFPGEIGAGLRSYSDKVSISCESDQWGGEPNEFCEYIKGCLAEWYDGASVTLIP